MSLDGMVIFKILKSKLFKLLIFIIKVDLETVKHVLAVYIKNREDYGKILIFYFKTKV